MNKKYKIYERDVRNDYKNIFYSSDQMYSVMENLRNNNLISDWMLDPIYHCLLIITDDLSLIEELFLDKKTMNEVSLMGERVERLNKSEDSLRFFKVTISFIKDRTDIRAPIRKVTSYNISDGFLHISYIKDNKTSITESFNANLIKSFLVTPDED